jgi:hypothetical protein
MSSKENRHCVAKLAKENVVTERTERDFWVEMSVRQIQTQCYFAERAYRNLDRKAGAGTDAVFSAIHCFLSHCASVSKLLRPQADSLTIEDVLKVSTTLKIHDRSLANHLEDYEERPKKWINENGLDAIIGNHNVGRKSLLPSKDALFVSHDDPRRGTFTFFYEDINLRDLCDEIVQVQAVASTWVQNMESTQRSETFI